MDLQKLIEQLNTKRYLATYIGEKKLTNEEKDLLNKYKPQNVFIAYGSLGPGRPNHHKIDHIRGEWKKGTVKGKLEAKGWGAKLGFYGYVKTSKDEENEIEAFVLFSKELQDHWKFLDYFEGYEYEREIAKFRLENGEIGIGTIYALKQ